MNLFITVFCLAILCVVDSYKILVFYPLPVRSINILGHGVVTHLLNAGHEITFITSYPMKLTHKNLRQINISFNEAEKWGVEKYNMGYILENKIDSNDVNDCQQMARVNAREALQNENVTRFLENSNEKFDVVLVDWFETEVYAGLSVLYDCPMIWVYSMGAHWQVLRLISEPTNPAYSTDYLSTKILPHNFLNRVEELTGRIHWYLLKIFVTKPYEKEIYETTFGHLLKQRGKPLPSYDEVFYNASLIFGNEHNAVSMRPNTPQNFKYIGGIHIEDPAAPLPKDLQELMDRSTNGVIYFSMGTFFKSKALPKALVRAILEVFGKLKQTVIWKFEAELNDVPKNVHIVKWAPQPSILAHPNCKLFISHGGLLSSIEAVHFGVPIIGIPVLFDQHANINRAVAHGYALHINLDYDLPKNLKKNINIMVNDNAFKNKIKELSQIYHDLPVKPGAELVHWVNHVIKTRGALHLRSPALNVSFYQTLYLDLAAILIIILIILSLMLKALFSIMCPKQKNKKQKRN